MKMALSRLWLLLLFISVLHRASAQDRKCRSPPTEIPTERIDKMQPADSFFDYNLCKDGLQWVCYIPRECYTEGYQKNIIYKISTTPETWETSKAYLKKCSAFMAIQPQSLTRRDTKTWRIVMQSNKVGSASKLQFVVNCKVAFECKPDGQSSVTGNRAEIFDQRVENWFGKYDKETGTLMCEFTIQRTREDTDFILDAPGNLLSSGMVAPDEAGNPRPSYEMSSTMYAAVLERLQEITLQGGIEKVQSTCEFGMTFRKPEKTDEEGVRVNTDRNDFACPENYQLRWKLKEIGDYVPNPAAFETATRMGCLIGAKEFSVTDVNGISKDRIESHVLAYCTRKKCNMCAPPTCADPAKCPRVITGSDFETCAKLKCKNGNEVLVSGDRPVVGEVVCKNDTKWSIDEVGDLECRELLQCTDVNSAVKMDQPEKFNISSGEVVCNDATADLGYKTDTEDVQLKAVSCNPLNGQWFEFRRKEVEGKPTDDVVPYSGGELHCKANTEAVVAQGNIMLYAGAACAGILVIIGIILIVCFCLRRKAKKNRVSALKHNLANKDSKSRESKSLSKGTLSKDSGVSSDRSVTGARGKKKREADIPTIPDDKEAKPEPRSHPRDASAIASTDKLKKLQEAEEAKKKTARATAALLESSKVGEEEEQQQQQPQSSDTPVDTAVIGKDSRNLDATQQPEQPPEPPRVLPMQKRLRPKKASIMEGDQARIPDVTQQSTADAPPENEAPTQIPANPDADAPPSTVAKTQMGGGGSDEGAEEKEQPMWTNQQAPAPDATQEPTTVAATADPQQDEMKTSREKERDAAADRKAKIADLPTAKKMISDLPTAKKKESAKKVKSSKKPKPDAKADSKEKKPRSSLLRPSDYESDKTSSKKRGGIRDKSSKKKKGWAPEPDKKDDGGHKHVHGSDAGCGPLCMPMPRSYTDPEEN